MKLLLPGSTIGILGGGQLGRMLAFEAKRMGYNVITLDPSPDCPCGQVADDQIVAAFDDLGAILKLGESCDVVTYEFENIDFKSVEMLESRRKRVCPNSQVLKITQNRLLEKEFLRRIELPVTRFQKVETLEELKTVAEQIGYPAVLKTASHGYDGKGQMIVHDFKQAIEALDKTSGYVLIWEKLIAFEKELGIICVRSEQGEIITYPVTENIHKENILDVSIIPARVSEAARQKANSIAEKIAHKMKIIGTFCVEMFLLPDGEILINEIAPRPHNSGHYTIDACVSSQFEQQLRAICGMPLGSAQLLSHAVMMNILGDGSGNTLCGVEDALSYSNVYLHLYGKKHAAAKRKMGHITVTADTKEEAICIGREVRAKLRWI